jgi:Zn ribbon nucleic-acid-binding protein
MAQKIEILHCVRCGHRWIPRRIGARPHKCPRCQAFDWQKKAPARAADPVPKEAA